MSTAELIDTVYGRLQEAKEELKEVAAAVQAEQLNKERTKEILEQECKDIDEVLTVFGFLEGATRTEGGRLKVGFIKEKFTEFATIGLSARLLGELLAILHRDGGRYTAKNGLKKSVEDATQVFYALSTKVEEREERIEELGGLLKVHQNFFEAVKSNMSHGRTLLPDMQRVLFHDICDMLATLDCVPEVAGRELEETLTYRGELEEVKEEVESLKERLSRAANRVLELEAEVRREILLNHLQKALAKIEEQGGSIASLMYQNTDVNMKLSAARNELGFVKSDRKALEQAKNHVVCVINQARVDINTLLQGGPGCSLENVYKNLMHHHFRTVCVEAKVLGNLADIFEYSSVDASLVALVRSYSKRVSDGESLEDIVKSPARYLQLAHSIHNPREFIEDIKRDLQEALSSRFDSTMYNSAKKLLARIEIYLNTYLKD